MLIIFEPFLFLITSKVMKSVCGTRWTACIVKSDSQPDKFRLECCVPVNAIQKLALRNKDCAL